ncbi:RagB/SusD family nutrient uptake outer membrane protein [Chitinophaga sp. Cy-1792]|uniref:RagB/SusD family nutrient uptake outer membrane protein n=1 Tax=Chitinophaga sp. Cy-1792 TaxID=2608339 RepID=UPI00141FBCA0|nr:RagB/SusD family nutrient uptake outer membrane protein [Chitinophaga sp. Cy-1792]NIG53837.1 RagB/SusD family nutrient uptake outer membrane protein [Chitinophaga sp. Cy-1792]
MRKIFLYICCGAMVVTASSCKKYLDLKPKGSFIPEKTTDYRLLLDETSPKGKSNGFFYTYGMDIMLDDDMAVNPFSQTYYNTNAMNAWQFAENIYLENESDADWEAMYNQIYTANLVTTQVMSASGGSDADRRQLMAEARVHRAYAYFMLVNLYAKQYGPAAATDPGVPIRRGLDFEEKLPRASVQDVYDYIKADLVNAIPDLPAAPVLGLTNRPVKSSAYTLLAKVSLFRNDAAAALSYADSSLKIYSTLIDYNTLTPNPSFPDVLSYPQNFKNPEMLLEKTGTMISPIVYATNDLLALYDSNNDLRFSTYFFNDKSFGLGFGYFSNEWSGRSATKGPSVPETWLIHAEANARLGNTAAAIQDINTLRAARYKKGSTYQLSAANAAVALSIVKTERRREMAFRGSRWFDIRRYNVFDNDNITVTHTLPNGTVYTLAPNSNRTALAIGRKYIAMNPEITQNPR